MMGIAATCAITRPPESERMFVMRSSLRQWILASLIATGLMGANPLLLSAQSLSEFAPLPGAPTPEERAARAAARLKQAAPVIEPPKTMPHAEVQPAPPPAPVAAPTAPASPTPPIASAPAAPKPATAPEVKEPPVSSASAAPPATENPPAAAPIPAAGAPEKSAHEKAKAKKKTEKTARKEIEEKARKEPEPKPEKLNLKFASKLPPDDKGPRAIDFLGTDRKSVV